VPSRDFALSKRFYQDLGFDLAWSSEDLAYVRHGNSSFLLQNFYNKEHAGNFMMHLLVESVEAWWAMSLLWGSQPRMTCRLSRRQTGHGEFAISLSLIQLVSCGASGRTFGVIDKRLMRSHRRSAIQDHMRPVVVHRRQLALRWLPART
jgi:hypothetical protein